jgi:hypothetical protein
MKVRFIHLNKLRFEFCLIQRYRLSINLFDKLPNWTWVQGDLHLLESARFTIWTKVS